MRKATNDRRRSGSRSRGFWRAPSAWTWWLNSTIALPKKYRGWLDLAGPLVTRSELVEFLRLRAGDRDGYVRRFWKRHGHVD